MACGPKVELHVVLEVPLADIMLTATIDRSILAIVVVPAPKITEDAIRSTCGPK